jgi:hypothetical protein
MKNEGRENTIYLLLKSFLCFLSHVHMFFVADKRQSGMRALVYSFEVGVKEGLVVCRQYASGSPKC